MKKENRKMAQERRAKERRKKELQRRISKIIVIALPLIAVIALIIAIIATNNSSDSNTDSNNATTESDAGTQSGSDDTGTDTDAASDESTSSPSYATDTSLTVEDGDTVNIDYVGSIDGVEFEGGNTLGQGADLTIGSGLYIDDFEEQLIGSHPGDQVDVYVTFPEDYGNEELNGKEALFEVTVNGIYQ
nr:FKBP-type peptidyl-prolyl cis-trans isomerase [uncultured Mediterraneibacter sp.]